MSQEFWDRFELRAKASAIGTEVVETEETKAVRVRLEAAIQSHRTHPMGNVGIIYGESFVGKTTACESFMEGYAEDNGGSFQTYLPKLVTGDEQDNLASIGYVEVPGPERPLKPIIMINVGTGPTYKGLLRDTIHALTRQMPTRSATNNALTITLGKQLRRQGTQMIIFDSAHSMAVNMNTRDQNFAGGLLISVCKLAKTEAIVVGDKRVLDLFEEGTELGELGEQRYQVSPFPKAVFQDSYKRGTEPEFYKFVADLLRAVEFKGKTDLLLAWELDSVYEYSRGLPGRVSKLLQLGAKYAVAHKADVLDSNILYLALRDLADTPDPKNPFFGGDNRPKYKPYPGPFTL